MNRKPNRRRTLRRRVAGGAATVFVIAWAAIFGQSAFFGRAEPAEAEAPPQPRQPSAADLILGFALEVADGDEEDEGESGGPAPVTSSQS